MLDETCPATLVAKIHAADARRDPDAFVALLSEDVQFRLGSAPPMTGRASVRTAVEHLFEIVTSLHHSLKQLWVTGDTIAFEAEVTYHLAKGGDLTLPYVDILRVNEAGFINDYKIYIDLAPLFSGIREAV